MTFEALVTGASCRNSMQRPIVGKLIRLPANLISTDLVLASFLPRLPPQSVRGTQNAVARGATATCARGTAPRTGGLSEPDPTGVIAAPTARAVLWKAFLRGAGENGGGSWLAVRSPNRSATKRRD